MPTVPAIEADHLTKLYPNGRGIQGVSFTVQQGEIFGFLGPNGAGKSTTIRTLMGFLTPNGGSARVLGHDVVTDSLAVRRLVGYLPSEPALYGELTGEQHLALSLRIHGKPELMGRAEALARRLEVDLGQRVRNLSRGQRQKVAIILALAHDPEVLILDEPTTGLDPLAQEVFHALLREEVGRGRTVFMSSHILAEVERMCERVAIIRSGRIVAQDSVVALKKQRVKRVAVEFRGSVPDFGALPGVMDLKVEGLRVRFTYRGPLDPLLGILAAHPVADMTVEDPSLEEIFMAFYAGEEVAVR